jgi:DNA-binding beta-propeller fold protein YncE
MESSNPLDPRNESTNGSPPGFDVVALDTRTELRWSPLRLEDLTGYNVYRRQGGSGTFVLLGGSPYSSALGSTIDSLLSNGTTYYYRLVPVIKGYGEGTPSPLLPATPGPHFAVVADAMAGTVTKFSADMRASVWTAGGFYYPFAAASDGERLWLTDLYGGVICLEADGKILWSNPDFILPLAISLSADGTSAVADFNRGTVTVLSPQGEPQTIISQELSTPASVSFGRGGEIWVADPGSGIVNKYSTDGNLLCSFGGSAQPRFLDADTSDGTCWVVDAESKEVIKLSSDAEEIFRVDSFSKPGPLAVDNKNGGCWISDSAAEEIVRVSDNGELLFRIGKVGRVVSVHVSPDDGGVWLADAGGDRILVLSPGGSIVFFINLPSPPSSITVVGAS